MNTLHTSLVAVGLALSLHAGEPASHALKNSIPLPGVEGRFDHAAMDAATHRLFFAALGNNTLEVVDVNTGKWIRRITDLKKPTGVLYLPDSNLLVVANGDDGTCRFYDGTTYAERGRITGLDDADNLRYDAKAKRIYLGYGSGVLGVIDPVSMKLTGSIPLPEHPEAFLPEESGSRIFVNIPDAKQIAVVDRVAGKVVATWPMEAAHDNFPMALDEEHHRLFVGCRSPSKLVVLSTDTGKVVASVAIAGDTDDLWYDKVRRRVYSSGGAGFITVIHSEDGDRYTVTGNIPTASGARTSFFDAKSDNLYLAVPRRPFQKSEIRVYGEGEL